MYKYYDAFSKALEKYVPAIHDHLIDLDIPPSMYLLDWIITLFSKYLPLNISTHVWDIFLVEGEKFLMRVGLGIVIYHQNRILNMEFEECFHLLKQIDENEALDHQELMLTIKNVKLPTVLYESFFV